MPSGKAYAWHADASVAPLLYWELRTPTHAISFAPLHQPPYCPQLLIHHTTHYSPLSHIHQTFANTMTMLMAVATAMLGAHATNFLMIAVDDLRPDIAGLYGQDFVKTPNLKRLQAMGTTFERAYCQVALCSPSRTSLLTGLRPDTSRVYEIGPFFRNTMPNGTGADVKTLPQWTKEHGLWTTGSGKIFHPGTSSGGPGKEGGGDGGYPFMTNGSWSEPYYFCDQFYNGSFQSPVAQDFPGEKAGCIQDAECIECLTKAGSITAAGKPAISHADCPDRCYPDGDVARETVRKLHSNMTQPFFLTAGLKRPHLGWFVPQNYWDKYTTEDITIATHRSPPNISHTSFGTNSEICGMDNINCTKTEDDFPIVADEMHQYLRHGYYSAVTFMDSQLGLILDALVDTALVDNTAVLFWGDHGYQLGEHGLWSKITNFELATRVPLIVALPHHPEETKGKSASGFVELLDVFPTVVEVLGLPAPEALQGVSLMPLLTGEKKTIMDATYSQIQRVQTMGLSMRVEGWRFTEWTAFNYSTGRAIYDAANTDLELYSHGEGAESDFNEFENENLAKLPQNKQFVAEMRAKLWAQWKN